MHTSDKLTPMEISHFDGECLLADKGAIVPASEKIMKHFNPNGLGGAKFFVYKGCIVCLDKDVQDVQKELNMDFLEKMHPKDNFKRNA